MLTNGCSLIWSLLASWTLSLTRQTVSPSSYCISCVLRYGIMWVLPATCQTPKTAFFDVWVRKFGLHKLCRRHHMVSTAMLSTDIYVKTLQLLQVIEPTLEWKLPETYQDVLVAGHIRKVRPELYDQPWAARCDIMLVGDLMDTCHVHDLGDQGLELKCSMQAGKCALLHLRKL